MSHLSQLKTLECEEGRALDPEAPAGVGLEVGRFLADEAVWVELGLEDERGGVGDGFFLRLRSSFFASLSSLSRKSRVSFLGGLDIIWERGGILER